MGVVDGSGRDDSSVLFAVGSIEGSVDSGDR